jgi:hypothetical protein
MKKEVHMRILCCGVVFCLAVSLARADDSAAARALIDKAMKAAGGEDKLAKLKGQSYDERGLWYGMGEGLPYTGKYDIQWPDRYRVEIEGIFTLVMTGDKGWIKTAQGTADMTEDQRTREKENLYAGYVAALWPLKDKDFVLALLPEITVEDRPAVGVKVTRKDRPDVSLYFDKKTGLLTKAEHMALAEDPKAARVKQETFMSQYKEIAGVKVPTKVVMNRDGKRYVEATVQDVKLTEKLDDSVFAKP